MHATAKPIEAANPATKAIFKPDLVFLAGKYPSTNSAISDAITDTYLAVFTSNNKYGVKGTNPNKKYEENIISPSAKGENLTFESTSCVELSDKKDPAPIDSASTDTAIIPVIKICALENWPVEAIPNKRPKVETRLSSAPNIKFLK